MPHLFSLGCVCDRERECVYKCVRGKGGGGILLSGGSPSHQCHAEPVRSQPESNVTLHTVVSGNAGSLHLSWKVPRDPAFSSLLILSSPLSRKSPCQILKWGSAPHLSKCCIKIAISVYWPHCWLDVVTYIEGVGGWQNSSLLWWKMKDICEY